MGIKAAFGTPFDEQIEFLINKLNLPSDRWDDIRQSANDRAFIVAGAAQADLIDDLRAAVEKAAGQGGGLEAFRKDFNALAQRHGWTGWTGEQSAAGRAWRTRVIYQTNMATSYAAGRYTQLKSPEMLATRPYWKYVHSDSVEHPRPLHQSWNGIVLPHDHPFWDTHFCPNGWGCQCRIVAVGVQEYEKAKAAGLAEPPPGWDTIDPKTGAPLGIDQGWAYAPGASVKRPLQELVDAKLINLSSPVGAEMYQVLAPVLQDERQAAYQAFIDQVAADQVKRGRSAVVGAIDSDTLAWLRAQHGIVPAGAEITVQDGLLVGKNAAQGEAAGAALSLDEWSGLVDLLAAPEQILYDTSTGRLIYILPTGRPWRLAVEFEYLVKRQRGQVNRIVAGTRVTVDHINAEIEAGRLVPAA